MTSGKHGGSNRWIWAVSDRRMTASVWLRYSYQWNVICYLKENALSISWCSINIIVVRTDWWRTFYLHAINRQWLTWRFLPMKTKSLDFSGDFDGKHYWSGGSLFHCKYLSDKKNNFDHKWVVELDYECIFVLFSGERCLWIVYSNCMLFVNLSSSSGLKPPSN